ncbi:MAG: Trm112 family protein [Limnobacter sp.]|nr:Trm112 family protein [Limnobacter sp.]
MDAHLVHVLVCPICKGKLEKRLTDGYLVCKADKLAYPVRDGIPIMIVEQAVPLDHSDHQVN